MARRVAVACVMALAVAASARAQSGSSGTSTGQSTTATQTQSSSTARRRRHDRRRRRSSATLDCGLCRPPRCSRTKNGPLAATAAARTGFRATRNVADFAGTFGVGIGGPRRALRLVPGRHAHRPRRAAGLRRRSDLRQLHRSLSPRQSVLDRRQHRRLLRRREVQHPVRVPPEPGGGRACAAWSSCRPATKDAGVSTGKTDFSVDLIASKEAAKLVEAVRLRRLRMARQPGRLRHRRAARSAGAPASASRRATGCASPAS